MGFYSTNNAKFRVYNTTRRLEQKYNDEQQDGLDELLAEQRGEVDMATRYARVAKSVINAFGDQIQQPKVPGTAPKATDYLNELIQTGRLSEAFDKIKKMNLEGLSPAAQDIVKNIQNPEIRKSIVSDFNNKVEQIMIKNGTPEQLTAMAGKASAEASALGNLAKNPGLAEMAAARARQLAENRDVAAFDMLRANRPKNDALLKEVLKTRAGLRKTPVNTPPPSPKDTFESINRAFVEAIGSDVDTAEEILDKAGLSIDTSAKPTKNDKSKTPSPTYSEAQTVAMTNDEALELTDIKMDSSEYNATSSQQMYSAILQLNSFSNKFSDAELRAIANWASKPNGANKAKVYGKLKSIGGVYQSGTTQKTLSINQANNEELPL